MESLDTTIAHTTMVLPSKRRVSKVLRRRRVDSGKDKETNHTCMERKSNVISINYSDNATLMQYVQNKQDERFAALKCQ